MIHLLNCLFSGNSDTESRINELRVFDFISLSLKNEAKVGYLFLGRRYVKLISSIQPEMENMII